MARQPHQTVSQLITLALLGAVLVACTGAPVGSGRWAVGRDGSVGGRGSAPAVATPTSAGRALTGDGGATACSPPSAPCALVPVRAGRAGGQPAVGTGHLPALRVEVVWATVATPHPLRSPLAVAVDRRRGDLYVVDAGHGRVQKFDRDGRFVTMWGSEGGDDGQFRFDAPCEDQADCRDLGGGVAVDGRGRVYVADYANHRVQVFDGAGRLLARWGRHGAGAGEFALPRAVAVDERDRVYVADYANHRIQQFDGQGRFLAQWGGAGAGAGRFFGPAGLAVDPAGDVYVADSWPGRVQVFDADGGYRREWQAESMVVGGERVAGLAVDGWGQVYLASALNLVQQVDGSGQVVGVWGDSGGAPGELRRPTGLAVDAEGTVYVADRDNHRVQRFRPLLPAAA